MPDQVTYCSTDDITLGDVEPPRFVSVQQYVVRAAEDIDAALGRVYQLPLQLSETDPDLRSTTLTLKKINIYLATGRLVCAAAGGSEDNHLHAWGLWHLKQAEAALQAIADGELRFPEQTLYADDNETEGGLAPIVRNKDSASFVTSFYEAGKTGPKPWKKSRGDAF